MTWNVAAFYRFVPLSDLPALQATLKAACLQHDICGTIVLAPEGMNGTIAGLESSLETIIDVIDHWVGIRHGELKYSRAHEKPFQRLKIRLKKEIITLRAPEADPSQHVGTYVDAHDWNALIQHDDVVVLDTRNVYETAEGKFKNAIDPNIQTFTQFKTFVEETLDPAQHNKVAMYCTGGIRCEKASAYLLAHGFKEVYHLKGGILKYLEVVPAEESRWEGTCFVFDERVALGHALEEKSKLNLSDSL